MSEEEDKRIVKNNNNSNNKDIDEDVDNESDDKTSLWQKLVESMKELNIRLFSSSSTSGNKERSVHENGNDNHNNAGNDNIDTNNSNTNNNNDSSSSMKLLELTRSKDFHDSDLKGAWMQYLDFNKLQTSVMIHPMITTTDHDMDFLDVILRILMNSAVLRDPNLNDAGTVEDRTRIRNTLEYSYDAPRFTRSLPRFFHDIHQYILQIREEFISDEALVCALIYVARVIENKHTILTRANVKPIYITAVLIAMKWTSDDYQYKTSDFVKFIGMSDGRPRTTQVMQYNIQRIHALELKLLIGLGYSGYVSKEQYLHALYLLSSNTVANLLELIQSITKASEAFPPLCPTALSHFEKSISLPILLQQTRDILARSRQPFRIEEMTSGFKQ